MSTRIAAAVTTSSPASGLAGRTAILMYGVAAYTFFLGVFLYMIGFVGGFGVPKGIDDGATGSVGAALAIDVALLGLFAVQHMVMARPAFKAWWTQFVPPAAERSTFVLAASALLALLAWQWRPFPGVVWSIEHPVAVGIVWAIYALGWGIVLYATFLIDHFELFGLRQVIAHALGRSARPAAFTERSLYRVVRHPLMLGFLVAFWAAPVMTWGRLVFAGIITAWVLLAIRIEERTLVWLHGEQYESYRRRVPALLPRIGRRRA
jgi:protein-S-isoprenylcysteine O-methyltransferase Ste14